MRWLVGDEPCDVLDLAAGTGKLTRALAALGHRVTAVESLPEMIEHLHAAVPAVTTIEGTAEAIPVSAGSFDVVTVAQAFHWFDQLVALAEIGRIMRPGGTLGLIWNTRDEAEPWVAELSEAATGQGRDGAVWEAEVKEVVEASALFGPLERETFLFTQRLDLNMLLDLVLSRSYCAVLPPAERRPVLDRVEEIFAAHEQDGTIELPYVTVCFRSRRL